MHLASLSIFQLDLRQQIINHTIEDEMYVQIKDKLQQQSLENRYDGYKLEEYGLITYKIEFIFQNRIFEENRYG